MATKDKWYKSVASLDSAPSTNCNLWLQNKGSMTKRMREEGGEVSVSVCTQGPHSLSAQDALCFEDISQQNTYLREVIMHVNQSAWLYGRSIICVDQHSDDEQALLSLHDSALGDYLFKQPGILRSDFEFSVLQPDGFLLSRLHHLTNKDYHALISRRSMFYLKSGSILLSEVFLPDMLRGIA